MKLSKCYDGVWQRLSVCFFKYKTYPNHSFTCVCKCSMNAPMMDALKYFQAIHVNRMCKDGFSVITA